MWLYTRHGNVRRTVSKHANTVGNSDFSMTVIQLKPIFTPVRLSKDRRENAKNCTFSTFKSNCCEISFQITYKKRYCCQKFQQQYIVNYLSKTVLNCVKMEDIEDIQQLHVRGNHMYFH